MTVYCLESGAEESDNAIIHKLECTSYDLGSLLGAGRLVTLGNFDSLLTAWDAVKRSHPDAIRCEHCCSPAQVVPLAPRALDARAFVAA
jgi:hypothetical protein